MFGSDVGIINIQDKYVKIVSFVLSWASEIKLINVGNDCLTSKTMLMAFVIAWGVTVQVN